MAPRYSIVAGDFAEDPRADVSHFRVYLMIGRHTDKAGWCRLKQITIGERIGLSRETVNRKLKDLCKWGYVEKKKHAAAGRAYYYRTIMDRGAPPNDPDEMPDDDAGDDQTNDNPEAMRSLHGSNGENLNVTRASHAGCNSSFESDGGSTPGVSAGNHTTCDHTPSHHNDPSSTALPNGKKESPPQPPAGGRVRAKRFNEIEAALREIEGDLETDPSLRFALDHVVGPLISQRRFDAPLVSSALRQLVKWVSERNLTTAEAAALVQKLLSERRASVKPADITDAVKLAVNNRPTPRQLTGDPALMSEWPRVMAELQRMIGEATAQQVFSTFVIDRVVPSRGGRVVAYVATHEQWRKKSVELSMSAQFRAALCAAFPNVTDVFIETRRPAA